MKYEAELMTALSDVCKKAEREGYEKCQSECKRDNERHYQQGLIDAWGCVRKLYSGMKSGDVKSIFGIDDPLKIVKKFSAREVMQKIEEFEKQKIAETIASIMNCSFKEVKDTIDRVENKITYTPLEIYEKKQTDTPNHDEIKVGMRVRTLASIDKHGCEVFPVGTIGIVKRIGKLNSTYPYTITDGTECWDYSRDMFEVMVIDEVKVGDIVKNKQIGSCYVVTCICGDEYYLMSDAGSFLCTKYMKQYIKTGETYSQIETIKQRLRDSAERKLIF